MLERRFQQHWDGATAASGLMRLQSHETEKDTDFQALSPSDYKLEGQTEKER